MEFEGALVEVGVSVWPLVVWDPVAVGVTSLDFVVNGPADVCKCVLVPWDDVCSACGVAEGVEASPEPVSSKRKLSG